jgi:pyruvate/2-oxoglutarate dehydrogenase complex dihydrolipoamide acyltransferase (E2) component
VALVDILMPQLGTSVVEGTLLEWHAAVGGEVAAEATICEISTDKIDSECPAPVAGTLAEILVEVGETVEVGTVLGRIATNGEVTAAAPEAASADEEGDAPVPIAAAKELSGAGAEVRSSPVARRIAAEHGIDLAAVPGTGRGGRVTKKDVLARIEGAVASSEPALHSDSPYRPDPERSPPPAGASAATDLADLGGTSAPLSRIRQRIGEAMLASQGATATCHTAVECDMSGVEARRAGLGLTALPLVSRAVIETLAEFPDLNATLDGTTITRYERVHLGMERSGQPR